MESPPSEVLEFLSFLEKRGVLSKPKLEKGGEKSGAWWLDFENLTIEWKPGLGFGFSFGTETAYGEGPSEIFKTPSRAAIRAEQLLSSNADLTTARLKTVRELYEKTQEQMAVLLKVQQAAISRLESRDDSKIETLSSYVQSLGGYLEVRAIFDDGQIPIYRSPNPQSYGPLESRSGAVA
jgi:DNA-binding XRE family transcriptional regulator